LLLAVSEDEKTCLLDHGSNMIGTVPTDSILALGWAKS
jgi:hypothetical protein